MSFRETAEKLKKYVPTPQENAIVKQVNLKFLAYYATGISIGILSARYLGTLTYHCFEHGIVLKKATLFPAAANVPAWVFYLPGGLVGEAVGRELGGIAAKNIISTLPPDSQLRKLMQKDLKLQTYDSPNGGDHVEDQSALDKISGEEIWHDDSEPASSETHNHRSKRTNGYGDEWEE